MKPMVAVKCTVCEIQFKSSPTKVLGKHGKICPNGHFNTVYEMKIGKKKARIGEKTGYTEVFPVPSGTIAYIDEELALEHSTKELKRRILTTRKLGFDRIQELELALQIMLLGYDQLIESVRPSKLMTALAEGAFVNKLEMAKRILGNEKPGKD